MESEARTVPVEDPLASTPYRALTKLGQGGMGVVYEAEHRALRKRVVVKLLQETMIDERFVDRFRIEAQALAAVNSPHVVSVSDLGQTPAGRPYLVMERLYGRSLRDALRDVGAFPVLEAMRIARQVLAGLAAAHRVGLVHRDIKGDNVFLCDAADGGPPLVKVLDFGIAKVLEAGARQRVEGPKFPTAEGILVGSPRSVSPEQAKFGPVDARTDVYAVGLLLYGLVAGTGPFHYAKDVVDILNAHLRDVPEPPSKLAKQAVPPDLDAAILKALAKRPEARFQNAESFADELATIIATLSASTQPLPLNARRPIQAVTVPLEPARNAPAPRADGTFAMRPNDLSRAIESGGLQAPMSVSDEDATPRQKVHTPEDGELLRWSALGASATERSQMRHEFLFVTIMSTVAFALIATILFRYLGYL